MDREQRILELYMQAVLIFCAYAAYDKYLRARTPARRATPCTRRGGKRGRLWARKMLLERPLYGQYDQLLQQLNAEDPKTHKKFLRIGIELFGEMVDRLTLPLQKMDTNMRMSYPVGLKVACTLRHMATGQSYTDLHFGFRVAVSGISNFIPKVCKAIIETYGPEVLKCPTTPEEWKEVAQGFASKWNYHNCIGALDGKHVRIQCPTHGGSLFYNYKKFHSFILMALCDANYNFLYVDVGAEGGAGDGGTWNRCGLAMAISNKTAGLPEDECLPYDTETIPYHIVGDDAFALNTWLMKPYSNRNQNATQRLYSYRLSRARRVVENAFGLLQTRWRIFGTTMQHSLQTSKLVVMAACVMHNLALKHYPFAMGDIDTDNREEFVPGAWRNDNLMADLHVRRGVNATIRAKAIRDYLAQYYTSEVGAVPWQERRVFPHGRPAEED